MKRILPAFALAAAFAAAPAFADALDSAAATAAGVAAGITEDDAKLSDDWQGKLAAGLDTKSGNTEKTGYNGHAEAKKLQGDTIVVATLDGAWEETEVTDSDGSNKRDERTIGNAKGEVNVKEKLADWSVAPFVYGDVSAEHDGVAGIKYRTIESAGVGFFLVDTDALKFSVEAGLAYVQEKLDGLDDDDYLAYRLAERADWVPDFAEGVSFFETADFLQDFDESDRYFANFEAGVDVPMFAGLSLTLKGTVNYNHLPAAGKEKTDRAVVAQVGYNF